jgi:hypothetical protein
MATVAGIKIKPKVKKEKITSVSIRENAKRDYSPKWDGAESWTGAQFTKHFRGAMEYYRLEKTTKELKPQIINWMALNDYTKAEIAAFKKTKDNRCSMTVAAVAACLQRGMPKIHDGFNEGRDSTLWLRKEIARIVEQGKDDIDETETAKPVIKTEVYVPNIQDRLRETAGEMSEDIDYAIDAWITDPEGFDPKAFKIVNLLRGKGAKAAHARFIKTFFARGMAELQELASGEADAQLKEGYKHVSRKNVNKLIAFYEGIMTACEQITAEAKILKKPRAKKIKPAEQIVAKLKFCAKDDKLAIVSTPPAQIVGAQGVVVYNVKTRKIGYYIATSSEGLGVKGTSLTDFTAKSEQKTLRKPPEQIKEFKEQNTQKRFETWFAKSVKTTETILNGRFNEDTVILKVYK